MEKPTKRKAFNFLRSYFDVVNELQNDTDKFNFLMAVINKQFLDEEPKEMSFLVKLCYSSQKHAIESSVKGWKQVSKTDLTGHPLTDPLTDPPTNPIQVQVKEQVQVEEKVKEEIIETASPFSFYNSLIQSGGEVQLVSDWLKVRKNKKATNTQTAYDSFLKEVKKSNLSINQVLIKCVENSWSGFKSEWQPTITTTKNINDFHYNSNGTLRGVL